jgi:hypothetical protein
LSRQSAHMAVQLSALRTSRTLLPRNIIILMLLVLIRLSKPQGLMQSEGLGKFKNSPHGVSNPRPSGLQHSALTTTLPRTLLKIVNIEYYSLFV